MTPRLPNRPLRCLADERRGRIGRCGVDHRRWSIGCLHVEVARANGAAKVILAGKKRLQMVSAFAPDALIDSTTQDLVSEVLRLTNSLGADVAICANARTSSQELAVESVRKRGKVILFGGVPKTTQ